MDNHFIKDFYKKYKYFDIQQFRMLNSNHSILKMSYYNILKYFYKNCETENLLGSIKDFYLKYPNFDILSYKKKNDYKNNITCLINYHKEMNEVSLQRNNKILKKGISLIIRAKNEELNIKDCIESVVDLVDEIIFVDNNSTDNTYYLMEEYVKRYENIKLYQYNINVPRAGIEHQNAIQNNSNNTLAIFYNWCLEKANYYNVFKWDADFICIRNNFVQFVNKYNLRERDDKFAIWFTGKTLFENDNHYYLNDNSYYNEFRVFSYKNGFKWYDGNTCEYTDPYLKTCDPRNMMKYIYPLFYEIKRTSIDEFKERSSLIDERDINDNKILESLKSNKKNELIYIDKNIINNDLKIFIYTPSLTFGGGNQFIINMYSIFKSFGFIVKVIPLYKNEDTNKTGKFNDILLEDILLDKPNFKPNYIFLNSIYPENIHHDENQNESKIIFITHSDVAYSNYFIEKYHDKMHKIITVNQYTIDKLSKLLNINNRKFYKIHNYIPYKKIDIVKIRNKRFALISRFSDDKNIPMLIHSLIDVFKKYSNYKCYLIGTYNREYDNYLKLLCKKYNISSNVIFTGFEDQVDKYYKFIDFIILPSVSEGAPYCIIEALREGLPIIASDVGGNSEMIQNDINGFLYEYDGIKEFETKNIYIKNYNEQLSIIGYIIKNEKDVILPFDSNDIYKINIFNENAKKISDTICKMIELNDNEIMEIKKNNIQLFDNMFHKNIYINQLCDILFIE